MKKIFKLKGIVQNYAWGNKSYIPNLLGIDNTDNKPFAELWMGAHSKAPSIIAESSKTLNIAIEDNPIELLGSKVAKNFNNKLPYLFKVLSSEKPLSIQAHPNLQQAQAGFAKENKQAIELTDFYRNYKDDNHKPELICALTEFHAMCGFRQADEIINNFKKCQLDEYLDSFKDFVDKKDSESLKILFAEVLSSKGIKKGRMLIALENSAPTLDDELTSMWVQKMMKLYENDIGALSPLFLNTFILQPGQAIYLKAGILHAYLQGTGMEIMANSDNVLRGGLTPKNIDVDELLSILDTQMARPEIQSYPDTNAITEYNIPINEFSLRRVNLHKTTAVANNGPSIAIVIDGNAKITSDRNVESLVKGDIVFISGDVNNYQLTGNGLIFIASTNL